MVPDRVADLFEGDQLTHYRQLEGSVIILNKTKLKIYFDKLLKIQPHSIEMGSTFSTRTDLAWV